MGEDEGGASQDASADGAPRVPGADALPRNQFANFRHMYESRDGGLCVFKDEHGHLESERATRLV